MFTLHLENDIFLNACPAPTGYLVQMFHVGTPESTKKMILKSTSCDDNHVRVVICTIAFGMGINCKGGGMAEIVHVSCFITGFFHHTVQMT